MAGQSTGRTVSAGNRQSRRTGRMLLMLMVLLGATPDLLQAQNKELSYVIFEESQVPAKVGDIAKDSNVSQLLGSKVFSTLRYRVLSQPDTHSELFAVDATKGELMTAARIDRENLCNFADICRLLVYVAIQQRGGAYFVTVKVNVNLYDINDHDPKFPRPSMAVSVTENLPRESIDIMPAMDPDIGVNTVQRYELVVAEDPSLFSLVVTSSLDGSLVPSLVVNRELDRETRDFYNMVVLAKDGGTPTRTGTLALNVTVEDVNDNPPVFTASEYNVSVNETLPRHSVLAKVRATDQDIGFNGEVRYRFSSRQTDDNANAFAIHDTTGEIRSVQDLTHLQGKTLRLIVESLDRGSKPLKAQAVVNVKVMDAVNNYPSIRLTTISGGNISLVEESAPPGYVVAHFIVVDTDTGANGLVSCTVGNSNFGLQKLIDKEYKITLLGTLNREQKSRFDVNVRCWDFGRPTSLTTSVSFSVIVEDVNDNSPVFTRKLYRKNVTEEQGPIILLRVLATDADIGENGRVTYRLPNTTSFIASLISVQADTGDIKAKRSFDREVYTILDFTVLAVDHGQPQNTATARVILDIRDINDCKPSLPAGYTLTVAENQPRDTVVGKIEAVDEDEDANGQISYHLLSDNNATRFFFVEETGVVRSRVMFDREARGLYHLSVLANDHGNPPKTNIIRVSVQITDVNDNTPKFERPSKTYNLVNISSVIPARSVIFLAKVKDADEGRNAQVDFGFASDSYGVFAINKTSGAVSTIRNLHPADSGTYRLVLLARDRGVHGARSAIATLSIVVVAENVTVLDSDQVDEDHIIIVVVLVCLTILTAACVTAILLRLRHTDRRDRRHHHGLPPESKVSYHLREVKGSGSNLSNFTGLGGGVGDVERGVDGGGGTVGGCGKEKGSWGGYDAVKGHGVEETCRPELDRESEERLIFFKMQLAEQYHEKDIYSSQNGKSKLLDKPPPPDEMMSSSSRETNGTDSGRGLSEDDSQALDSVRSETESGFSSFLAMPLKDGWRHVGNHEYVNSPQTSLKTVVDAGSPTSKTTTCNLPPGHPDRHCPGSQGDLDLEKPRLYENTGSQPEGALRSFRTYTPKKPTKSVHFKPHGSPDSTFRKTLPSPSSTTTNTSSSSLKSLKSRFQPQYQSVRPRGNAAQPAKALSDYVNTASPKDGVRSHHGELGYYGVGGRGDLAGDSLTDSGDTADDGNTTTSGSYTMDHEDNVQDLQSDMFV